MARLNANDSEEVKLEKLRVDLEKFRALEAHKTTRYLGLGLLATISLGIVAWAMVRVTDKPAWLEVVLAMIALLSGPTFLLIRTRRRLKRTLIEVDLRSAADPADEARPQEETT